MGFTLTAEALSRSKQAGLLLLWLRLKEERDQDGATREQGIRTKPQGTEGGRSKCGPEESLKKSLFCWDWVQSTCSHENWALNYSSPSSDLAPFCDFRKRKDKQKKKEHHFPFSIILKSNMGKAEGHAGSCEEPPCRWQNHLWSRNDHSWGEPEFSYQVFFLSASISHTHSHTCVTNTKHLKKIPAFQKGGAFPSTTKTKSSGRCWHFLQKGVSTQSSITDLFIATYWRHWHLKCFASGFSESDYKHCWTKHFGIAFFPLKNEIWLKCWNNFNFENSTLIQ